MLDSARGLAASRLAVVAAALVALVALAATAGAATIQPVPMGQQQFSATGDPRLGANLGPTGGLLPNWSICAPGAGLTCRPTGITGLVFEPGPSAPGTEFMASAEDGGVVYLARSAPWKGTVAATAPPVLTGASKVGQRVTPAGATWSGGWGDEFDVLSVEACRTADAQDCVTIGHPWAMGAAQDGSTVLDARLTGRHLFAIDHRYARGTPFPAIAYGAPQGIPPATVGPTVARSAPIGPVTGLGPLTITSSPTLVRGRRLIVGRATCARRCLVAVSLTASGPDGGVSSSRVRFRGTRRLAVPTAGLSLSTLLTVSVGIGRTPRVTQTLAPLG